MGTKAQHLKDRYGKPKDECYTMLEAIAKEVESYSPDVWEGKHVYCPCDAPWSNFTKYFIENFGKLKLKKLTCSNITDGTMMEITSANDDVKWVEAEGDAFCEAGDFRSFQSKEIMKECDIIVTNPPFSLALPFLSQIVGLGKKYLYVDHQARLNCRSYFLEFWKGNLRIGNTTDNNKMLFRLHHTYNVKKGSGFVGEDGNKYAEIPCVWVTNLPAKIRSLPKNDVEDVEEYIKGFPRFAKHPDVVSIKYLKDIPTNYYGVMGVPLTYIKYHNPDEYVVYGQNGFNGGNTHALCLEGKTEDDGCEFGRIFIQRLRQ